MRNVLVWFEFKYWLKSPITYLLFAGYFFFALVMMLGTGGYFDLPTVSGEPVRFLNSPYAICFNSIFMTKLLAPAVAIVASQSLYRDYR
ncbi:MAG: hypothetical protein KTR24_01435, partial [Saprospiraceae bacterium]|nr:hypothetical protein [Saprospiraceae bacterium]